MNTNINIINHNVHIKESFKKYIDKSINEYMMKMHNSFSKCTVILNNHDNLFHVGISINDTKHNKKCFHSDGENEKISSAFNESFLKLKKQLRRDKTKFNKLHN